MRRRADTPGMNTGRDELVREEPLPLELMEDEEFLDNLDQV